MLMKSNYHFWVFVFTHMKSSLPLTAFLRNTYIITCLLTYNLLTYELLHEDNHKHMSMSANSSIQLIHNNNNNNKSNKKNPPLIWKFRCTGKSYSRVKERTTEKEQKQRFVQCITQRQKFVCIFVYAFYNRT